MPENAIAKDVVDAAFRIRTTLGPGLLESAYLEDEDHAKSPSRKEVRDARHPFLGISRAQPLAILSAPFQKSGGVLDAGLSAGAHSAPTRQKLG